MHAGSVRSLLCLASTRLSLFLAKRLSRTSSAPRCAATSLSTTSIHLFPVKVANWGWSHYARRELVYYNNSVVKSQDSFVIVCNIKSSPTVPDVPSSPRLDVPKSLLETFGSLLLSDNPAHADVEFILPRRGQDLSTARHIYASRQLLSRVEYFRSSKSAHRASRAPLTSQYPYTPLID